MLTALSPANDFQRSLQSRALQLSSDLAQTRWLLLAQKGSSIPIPFLVVLVTWLAVIFCSVAGSSSSRTARVRDSSRSRFASPAGNAPRNNASERFNAEVRAFLRNQGEAM